MPVKKRDYTQAYNKDGTPKFEVTRRGPEPVLIPISKEYEIVYVQNLATGEISEQSTKAARLFYADRALFRFLEPVAGAKAYEAQRAGAMKTDDSGRVNFEELYENPSEAPRFAGTAVATKRAARKAKAEAEPEGEDLDDDDSVEEDLATENELLKARLAVLEEQALEAAKNARTPVAARPAARPAAKVVGKDKAPETEEKPLDETATPVGN